MKTMSETAALGLDFFAMEQDLNSGGGADWGRTHSSQTSRRPSTIPSSLRGNVG